MHMKQSPYQLHPQQFLSSSSSFYIMLHMCILCCVSSIEKKTYSEKYEWESLLLLSELSSALTLLSSCSRITHTHTQTHTHTRYVYYYRNVLIILMFTYEIKSTRGLAN